MYMYEMDFFIVKKYYNKLKFYIDNNKERDSIFYDNFIELIDEFWKVRKLLQSGDKIIGILMYHDCLAAAVNKRQACFYIEGRYDKYRHRTDVFPDWKAHILECEDIKNEYNPIIEDTIKAFDDFFNNNLNYLPYFYGYYGKTYLKLILNEEKTDYVLDLDFLDKHTNIKELNEELYQHIQNNPLDFIDELRS